MLVLKTWATTIFLEPFDFTFGEANTFQKFMNFILNKKLTSHVLHFSSGSKNAVLCYSMARHIETLPSKQDVFPEIILKSLKQ